MLKKYKCLGLAKKTSLSLLTVLLFASLVLSQGSFASEDGIDLESTNENKVSVRICSTDSFKELIGENASQFKRTLENNRHNSENLFLSLPEELHVLILKNLPPKAITHLFLTCKKMSSFRGFCLKNSLIPFRICKNEDIQNRSFKALISSDYPLNAHINLIQKNCFNLKGLQKLILDPGFLLGKSAEKEVSLPTTLTSLQVSAVSKEPCENMLRGTIVGPTNFKLIGGHCNPSIFCIKTLKCLILEGGTLNSLYLRKIKELKSLKFLSLLNIKYYISSNICDFNPGRKYINNSVAKIFSDFTHLDKFHYNGGYNYTQDDFSKKSDLLPFQELMKQALETNIYFSDQRNNTIICMNKILEDNKNEGSSDELDNLSMKLMINLINKVGKNFEIYNINVKWHPKKQNQYEIIGVEYDADTTMKSAQNALLKIYGADT